MEAVPIRCRIPEHLERLGRDQQWLAEKTGMPKQQISDYVRMRYLLGIAKARLIAQLLKCSVEELYEWSAGE